MKTRSKSNPRQNKKGNPVKVVGTWLDITEQKKAESELIRYRNNLEELVKERTADLESEITERKRVEEEKSGILHELNERVKELNCLHEMAKIVETFDISLEEILKQVANILPDAWPYPDNTCARIILEDNESKTENFKITKWRQFSDIKIQEKKVGIIEIYYLEEKPIIDEGLFLKEEKILIDIIAERLGRVTERKQAEEELKKHREHLEELVKERTEKLELEITERKHAEEALRDSETKFRTVVEGVPVGISISTPDRQVLDANPALWKMFGFASEEEFSEGPASLHWYDPQERDQFVELFNKSSAIKDYETRFVRKDGVAFWVSLTSTIHKTVNGEIWMITASENISHRKEAEEALQKTLKDLKRSNEELEQFAYVASHDLQEPLRMVSSFTQLLEKKYSDKLDKDAHDFIHFAVDGASRMQILINDLLEFSRVSTRGKEFVKLDASSVLGQAISNLHSKISETGALVTNDDLPFIKGDESQLVRLFQNLIDNAIKFRTERAPIIHISCHAEPEYIKFSVKDNGIGIAPQHFERIFQIFQRLHSKVEYPGTGVGLAICKRIIERHNGKIWLESEVDSGTTFFFTINK